MFSITIFQEGAPAKSSGKCPRKGKGGATQTLLYRILSHPSLAPERETEWQMGAPQRPSLKEPRDRKSSIVMEAHRCIFGITLLLPLVGRSPPTVEPLPSLVIPLVDEEETGSSCHPVAKVYFRQNDKKQKMSKDSLPHSRALARARVVWTTL